MDNTTSLLARHQSLLASRKPLLADVFDPALASLLPQAKLHTDLFTLAQQVQRAQFAPWPHYQGEDLLILPLPKSLERLSFLLAQLAGQIQQPLECWLVGPAKGGIKGALKHLEAACTKVSLKDSARHCKLYTGYLQPAAAKSPWQYFELNGKRVASLPGVFSHGRLDEGSALLLEDLQAAPAAGKRVLDVGCGAGVLSLHLAQAGHQLSAVDISATAVAACQQTLADNALEASVFASNFLSEASGRFHAIISNPPFHTGMNRDLGLAKRLIEQSREHLYQDGELRLVANRNLPYHDWLTASFNKVSISRETSRFRIWRATGPRQM